MGELSRKEKLIQGAITIGGAVGIIETLRYKDVIDGKSDQPISLGQSIGDVMVSAPSLTATGLTVLAGAAIRAGYQFKLTHKNNMKHIRITPKERMNISFDKVVNLTKMLSTFVRKQPFRFFKGKVWLTWDIIRKNGVYYIYASCPAEYINSLLTELRNCYPEATYTVEDSLPEIDYSKGSGGHFRLAKDLGYGLNDDPVNHMAEVLSHMNNNMHMRITFTPSSGKELKKKAEQAEYKLLNKDGKKTKDVKEKQKALGERYTGKTGFKVAISIWGQGNVDQFQSKIHSYLKDFNQLKFIHYRIFGEKRNSIAWPYLYPPFWRQMLLSGTELGKLLLLPETNHAVMEEIPHLSEGQTLIKPKEFNEGLTIGYSNNPLNNVEGSPRLIKLSEESYWEWHFIVVGATGSGKGGAITTWARDFLNNWCNDLNHSGFTYIDPHQDTALAILSYLMHLEATGHNVDWSRVHYYHFGDPEYVPGLNLIHKFPRDNIDDIAEDAASTIMFAYPGELTKSEVQLFSGLATLLADNEPRTIGEIKRVFRDKRFRNQLLEKVRNLEVHEFWAEEDEKNSNSKGRKEKQTNIDAVLTRLNPFFRHQTMQAIFNQTHNVIDADKFFNEGHIVLIDMNNAPKNIFKLAGSHIVNKYYRQSFKGTKRRHYRRHYLVIDEAQLVQVPLLPDILQECRKKGLSLGLMTQDVENLEDDVVRAVKKNAGIIMSFDPGTDRSAQRKAADLLGGSFSPDFLKDQNTLNAAVALRGNTKFTVKVDPPFFYLNKKTTGYRTDDYLEAKQRALQKAMELMKRPGESKPIEEIRKEIYKRSIVDKSKVPFIEAEEDNVIEFPAQEG